MNIDDPKLTAFALDELGEPERATIARAVANSPDAQCYVDETRELARVLKSEFAPEWQRTPDAHSQNLISIQDDPWFWSIARPLANAAALAICAIVVAVALSSYRSQHRSLAARTEGQYAVEAETSVAPGTFSEVVDAVTVPNPLPVALVGRLKYIVVAEHTSEPNGEMRVVEVIADDYRVQRLRESLLTPVLSKKSRFGAPGSSYELLFLDADRNVIVSASFCRAANDGFVLRLSRHAPQNVPRDLAINRYDVLPGQWDARVNYSTYAIPFPNWADSMGYCPGA